MIHNITSETLLQEALVQVQKPTEVLGTHGSKYLLKWNGDRLESAQITGLALRGAQVKIDQANYFLAHGYPINKALLAATFRPGAPEPQHESEEQAPVSAEQPVIVGEAPKKPIVLDKEYYHLLVDVVYYCTEEELPDLVREDAAESLMEDPWTYTARLEDNDPRLAKAKADGEVV